LKVSKFPRDCFYKRAVDGKIAFLPQKEFVVFEGKGLIESDVIINPLRKDYQVYEWMQWKY